MPILDIILWTVAVLAGLMFLLWVVAAFFVFLGAMSLPEDLNDDVPGDRK